MIIGFKRILKVYNHTVNIYGQNQCWQCSCPDTLTLIRPLRLQRYQSTTNICNVMSSCCCKCKLLENSRLFSHGNRHTKELSWTFHQINRLFHHTFCYTLETPWKMYMRINWNTQLLLTSTSTKDWWVNHWRIFNFSNYS